MADPPLITLIMPSLNGGTFLREALHSVRRQGFADLELIVADGGSSDATMSILREFPEAQVFRRQDAGSHDAMNKALADTQGPIIGFLNTDDFLPQGALATVITAFRSNPTVMAVRGSAAFFQNLPNGSLKFSHVWVSSKSTASLLPSLAFGPTCFNAWFFRAELFKKVGQFDPSLNFSADREFLLRVALSEESAPIHDVIYGYRMHDGSRTMSTNRANVRAYIEEHLRFVEDLRNTSVRTKSWIGLLNDFEAFENLRMLRYADGYHGTAFSAFHLINTSVVAPKTVLRCMRAIARRRQVYRDHFRPQIDEAAIKKFQDGIEREG